MINSIDKLIEFLKEKENIFTDPLFKRSYQMYLGGIDNAEYEKIKNLFPDIPNSYLEIVRNYNILDVCVGMFEIYPSSRCETVVQALIESKEDPFFPKEFMEKHMMYQIGSYNTDLLCLSCGTDKFSEGEILFVDEGDDIYHPKDSQINPIAKDFEQFLIIAGNWNQIYCEVVEDGSNYKEKRQEFFGCLKALNVNERYHSIWLSLF